jgi:hypothetical protein
MLLFFSEIDTCTKFPTQVSCTTLLLSAAETEETTIEFLVTVPGKEQRHARVVEFFSKCREEQDT